MWHLEGKSNNKSRPRFDIFGLALSYRTPATFGNGQLVMGIKKCIHPEFPELWADGDGQCLQALARLASHPYFPCDLKLLSVSIHDTRPINV
jgi:hypothetical protein